MQIITGKYRSRKLVAVDSSLTRPTLGRIKESIFNIIQWDIEGSVVLDLFAGSGAFGAECISRGAKKVYFVDLQKKAIDTIKINTKNMNEDFEILQKDFKSALSFFASEKIKFDIIYLDPPYMSDFYEKSLELIENLGLLSENGKVVIEYNIQNKLKNISKYYIICNEKKYGDIFVDILKANRN